MTIVENTLGSAYNQILYLSGQNSTSLKIADAVRMLNYAINDYNLLAHAHDRRWRTDDVSNASLPETLINLVAGTNKYAVDDDYLGVHGVHRLDGNGQYVPLTPLTGHERDGSAFSAAFGTTGTPTHFTLDGNYVTVYPTPATSVTSGLKLFLSRGSNHIASTTLSTVIGISPHHIGYLVFHVLNQMGIRTTKAQGASVPNTLAELKKSIARHLELRGGPHSGRMRSNSRAVR